MNTKFSWKNKVKNLLNDRQTGKLNINKNMKMFIWWCSVDWLNKTSILNKISTVIVVIHNGDMQREMY